MNINNHKPILTQISLQFISKNIKLYLSYSYSKVMSLLEMICSVAVHAIARTVKIIFTTSNWLLWVSFFFSFPSIFFSWQPLQYLFLDWMDPLIFLKEWQLRLHVLFSLMCSTFMWFSSTLTVSSLNFVIQISCFPIFFLTVVCINHCRA